MSEIREHPYLDLRDRLDLLEVIALAVAQVTCGDHLDGTGEETTSHAPLLWYIGSAIGPARSKTCVAGKP